MSAGAERCLQPMQQERHQFRPRRSPRWQPESDAKRSIMPSLRLQEFSLLSAQRQVNDVLQRASPEDQLKAPKCHRLKGKVSRTTDFLKCAASVAASSVQTSIPSAAAGVAAGDQAADDESQKATTTSATSDSTEEACNDARRQQQSLCPRRRREIDDQADVHVSEESEEKEEEDDKLTTSDAFSDDEESDDDDGEAEKEEVDELKELDTIGHRRRQQKLQHGLTNLSQHRQPAKGPQPLQLQRHCCVSSQTTISIQLGSQGQAPDTSSSTQLGSSAGAPVDDKATALSARSGKGGQQTSLPLQKRHPQFLLSATTWGATVPLAPAPGPVQVALCSAEKPQDSLRTSGDTGSAASQKKHQPQVQPANCPGRAHQRCNALAAAPIPTLFTTAVQTSMEPRTSTNTGTATETPTMDNSSAPAASGETPVSSRQCADLVMPMHRYQQQHYHRQRQQSSSALWRSRPAFHSQHQTLQQLPARHRHHDVRQERNLDEKVSTAFLPSDSFSSSALGTSAAGRRHKTPNGLPEQRLQRTGVPCRLKRLTACPTAQRLFLMIEVAAACETLSAPMPRLDGATLPATSSPHGLLSATSLTKQTICRRRCLQIRCTPPTLASLCLLQQRGLMQLLPLRPLRLRQRASACRHHQIETENQPSVVACCSFAILLRHYRTDCRVIEKLSLTARLFPYATGAEETLGSALQQHLFYPEDILLTPDDVKENRDIGGSLSSRNPPPPLSAPTALIGRCQYVAATSASADYQRATAQPAAPVFCAVVHRQLSTPESGGTSDMRGEQDNHFNKEYFDDEDDDDFDEDDFENKEFDDWSENNQEIRGDRRAGRDDTYSNNSKNFETSEL